MDKVLAKCSARRRSLLLLCLPIACCIYLIGIAWVCKEVGELSDAYRENDNREKENDLNLNLAIRKEAVELAKVIMDELRQGKVDAAGNLEVERTKLENYYKKKGMCECPTVTVPHIPLHPRQIKLLTRWFVCASVFNPDKVKSEFGLTLDPEEEWNQDYWVQTTHNPYVLPKRVQALEALFKKYEGSSHQMKVGILKAMGKGGEYQAQKECHYLLDEWEERKKTRWKEWEEDHVFVMNLDENEVMTDQEAAIIVGNWLMDHRSLLRLKNDKTLGHLEMKKLKGHVKMKIKERGIKDKRVMANELLDIASGRKIKMVTWPPTPPFTRRDGFMHQFESS